MKRIILISVILFLAIGGITGCGKSRSSEFTWTTQSIARSDIYNKVRLSYPEASGGVLADSINSAVARQLLVGLFNEPDMTYASIEEYIDATLAEKRQDEMLAHVPYEFQSEGSIFRRDGITTLEMDIYYFTGGAHGMTVTTFTNFEDKTGMQLSVSDIFSDTVKLNRLNREAFKKFLATQKAEYVEYYLFVAPDSVSLPLNIGFSADGIKMLYNQYEVAAYAFGQLEYVIPYDQVADILIKYR